MSDIKISELGLVQTVGVTDVLPIVQNGVTVKVTGQEIADSISQINDLANKTYVDTAINNLIDGAPGMLDTLEELANAVGNDPNFYNDLMAALNNKLNDTSFQGYFDVAFAGKNTYHLTEGSNLYFTNQRALDAIGTDPTFNSVTITGDIVNPQDAVTKSYVDNQVSSVGGSSFTPTRETVSVTTTTLTQNQAISQTVVGAKGYALYSIQVSAGAWVTVYSSVAARTADATRSVSTDPANGAGILAEIISTSATTQFFTPAVIGYSAESPPNTNIPLKIVNNTGSSTPITVTLTFLPLES